MQAFNNGESLSSVRTKLNANATDAESRLDTAETKLAGIEAGATADQTGAEIKAAYEAEANTNAFTDAEKAKLAAVNALVTAGVGLTLNVAAFSVDSYVFAGGSIDLLASWTWMSCAVKKPAGSPRSWSLGH